MQESLGGRGEGLSKRGGERAPADRTILRKNREGMGQREREV